MAAKKYILISLLERFYKSTFGQVLYKWWMKKTYLFRELHQLFMRYFQILFKFLAGRFFLPRKTRNFLFGKFGRVVSLSCFEMTEFFVIYSTKWKLKWMLPRKALVPKHLNFGIRKNRVRKVDILMDIRVFNFENVENSWNRQSSLTIEKGYSRKLPIFGVNYFVFCDFFGVKHKQFHHIFSTLQNLCNKISHVFHSLELVNWLPKMYCFKIQACEETSEWCKDKTIDAFWK